MCSFQLMNREMPLGNLGVLVLRQACLLLEVDGSDNVLPLWPEGYTFQDGVVIDSEGASAASVGDSVELTGGVVDTAVAVALISTAIPESCGGSSPFVVGDLA